jgi:hypothetical protein
VPTLLSCNFHFCTGVEHVLHVRDMSAGHLGVLLHVQGGECPRDVPAEIKDGLEPALGSLAPGQCVILANTGVFHLASHVHNIWLDALYVRLTSQADSTAIAGSTLNDAPRALAVSSQGSTVFATDFTIQGDGGQQAVALWVGSSSIHIEGTDLPLLHTPILPITMNACRT